MLIALVHFEISIVGSYVGYNQGVYTTGTRLGYNIIL